MQGSVKPSGQTNAEGLKIAEERDRYKKYDVTPDIDLPPFPKDKNAQLLCFLSIAQRLAKTKSANDAYSQIALLLNSISDLVYSSISTTQPPRLALIFTLSRNGPLPGDYLDTREKPDLVGFMGDRDQLTRSLRPTDEKVHFPLPNPPAWAEDATILEDKRSNSNIWQIVSYCRNLKRYRPDLKVVYGLSIEKSNYTVLSSDPSVTRSSKKVPLTSLSGLYRYVEAVYRSIEERDPFLRAAPKLDGQVWLFDEPGLPAAFAPLYVGHARGKMSWVGIESSDQPRHVLKMSWQDERRRFQEGEMYDLIHSDKKWLPGVARHTKCLTLDQVIGDRKKSVVVLESIGEPLSECGTVRRLLETVFDAAQVLQEMNHRGVLHRDVSWFNVLCHSKHKESEREEHELNTIGKVMHLDDKACRVLILDLDNAAQIDTNGKIVEKPGEPTERTGTPMFIPVEISQGYSVTDVLPSQGALKKLQKAIMRPLPPPFTDFEQNLITPITTYLQDHISQSSDEGLIPQPVHHRPHHDIESLFWCLVWTVVRSRTPDDEEMKADRSYDAFCKMMLEHSVGGDESTRAAFRQRPHWSKYLRPSLGFLSDLLSHIGIYLSIAWPASIVLPWDHAHTVIKRLLLLQLIELPETDIHLSNIPRYFDYEKFRIRQANLTTMFSTPAASKRHALDDPSPRESKRRRTAPNSDTTKDSDHDNSGSYIEGDEEDPEFIEEGEQLEPESATETLVPKTMPEIAELENSRAETLFWQPEAAGAASEKAIAFRKLHWLARARWFGSGA